MLTKRDTILWTMGLAIIGTVITVTRKYHLSKIGVSAVTLLDIIMTGSILVCFIFATTPLSELKNSFTKLTHLDYISVIFVSSLIAFSLIMGRKLLLNNEISSLALINTIIDIFLSVSLGYLIYNEQITKWKIIGIIFVMIGSYFITD